MLELLLISSDETQYVDAENAFREIGVSCGAGQTP
jgi:hypothetical protein